MVIAALNENLKTGQIEERDYLYFKKTIDNSVKMLGDLVPDWHMPPIREFLKQIPFFQFLDDKTINNLLLESKEMVYENDVKVIKVYLFLILMGLMVLWVIRNLIKPMISM